jgi:hypothetical protein
LSTTIAQLEAERSAGRQRTEELQTRIESDAQRLEAASATIHALEAQLRLERERTATAEQAPADSPAAPAEPAPTAGGERSFAQDRHVLFLNSGDAYRLVELEGPPPEIDEVFDLHDPAGTFRVVRLGVSPFPNDRSRCAYLEPFAPV